MRRIGIDVGGTNTDAVLIEDGKVVRAMKAPTSEDVTTGILDSIKSLGSTGVLKGKRIDGVMIGTTHFTNAIVERRRLVPVAAIRLGLPATRSLPPLTDWPDDLAAVVGRHRYMLRGGNEFDGREIAPLDEIGVRNVARELKQKNITAAAISSVFSPVTAEMEQRAAAIVAEEVPGIRLSLSHEIGRIGFLERENATLAGAGTVSRCRSRAN
jgi:N-methylhydantoinase A/oxoprolinase/acetone carboxylase beta subunit